MNFNQNFNDLRQKCLSTGKLFEDPEFQPSDKILMKSQKAVQWKRPKDICSRPRFVVEGFSRFDVKQGVLGNCWFLAALETLTQNRQLFEKVVPLDNTFEKGYTGIFRFRFWRYGKWTEIVIDDRLPTVDGTLIYLKAAEFEFWPALLEKAYAKLYGSYSAIDGGTSTEAMVDFSGGVIERIKLKPQPPNLFNTLMKAKQLGSLVTASIFEDNIEKRLKGLVGQHAYSVTNFEEITLIDRRRIQLLIVKNPWGRHEWNGAFADNAPEWKLISSHDHRKLKREIKDDGEFFMTLEDFTKNFDRVELCHLCPDAFDLKDCSNQWMKSIYEDKWVEGEFISPQVIVKLDSGDEGDKENLCTIIVALMQKHRRNLKAQNEYIKFEVFKASSGEVNQTFLEKQFFRANQRVARHEFEPYREIVARFKLPPGYYVIVPSIESAKSGEFMLRVFTEAQHHRNNPIVKINRRNHLPENLNETVTFLDICDDHKHKTQATEMIPKVREQTRSNNTRSAVIILVIVIFLIAVYIINSLI